MDYEEEAICGQSWLTIHKNLQTLKAWSTIINTELLISSLFIHEKEKEKFLYFFCFLIYTGGPNSKWYITQIIHNDLIYKTGIIVLISMSCEDWDNTFNAQ
jgi:hypothetical protein